MNKRHINFYCNLSLLFFCNIFTMTIVKVAGEWPTYVISGYITTNVVNEKCTNIYYYF